LIPVTLPIVEAILAEDLSAAATLIGAVLPSPWPGRVLIEQAFAASLDAIRKNPAARLWGDRIALSKDPAPKLIGSVIFHGMPDESGMVEIGYGIELGSQGLGYASEAVRAQIEWAFETGEVKLVRATTPPWHAASIRVLERAGLSRTSVLEHESLGEVLLFERHVR
jgi:[ribosomal protein S5]-alanine N-acetyltransferase